MTDRFKPAMPEKATPTGLPDDDGSGVVFLGKVEPRSADVLHQEEQVAERLRRLREMDPDSHSLCVTFARDAKAYIPEPMQHDLVLRAVKVMRAHRCSGSGVAKLEVAVMGVPLDPCYMVVSEPRPEEPNGEALAIIGLRSDLERLGLGELIEQAERGPRMGPFPG